MSRHVMAWKVLTVTLRRRVLKMLRERAQAARDYAALCAGHAALAAIKHGRAARRAFGRWHARESQANGRAMAYDSAVALLLEAAKKPKVLSRAATIKAMRRAGCTCSDDISAMGVHSSTCPMLNRGRR